jgi:3-hydroxybutyrate dehydrogenase
MAKVLAGKCVLVTGSTSGIGWGTLKQFAKAGCRVMLHGLEKENEVSSLKQELESMSGAKVCYSNADLLREASCKQLVEETIQGLGKLDIVVNNAGIQFTSSTQDFPTDQWNRILAVCLNAPFFISRSVLPHMYAQKWGRLIHIGSAHSLVGSPNKSAYCAAKHGVLGLSRVIALEAAGTGVTSNTICPGWVLTPLVKMQIERISKEKGISIEEASNQLVLDKHPSPDFITPEKLGSLAVYLSSDDASLMTGAALSMDAGWTTR